MTSELEVQVAELAYRLESGEAVSQELEAVEAAIARSRRAEAAEAGRRRRRELEAKQRQDAEVERRFEAYQALADAFEEAAKLVDRPDVSETRAAPLSVLNWTNCWYALGSRAALVGVSATDPTVKAKPRLDALAGRQVDRLRWHEARTPLPELSRRMAAGVLVKVRRALEVQVAAEQARPRPVVVSSPDVEVAEAAKEEENGDG